MSGPTPAPGRSDSTTITDRPPRRAPGRRDTARVAGAVVIGVAVTLFAVFNLDDVDVNWVFGSWSTPLIIVIVVCFLLGVAGDRLFILHRSRQGKPGRAPARSRR